MEGKEVSVTSAAFDSASNNRRTRFLLFSFSKVGHELYSATRNYQPCGKSEDREGRIKSRGLVHKTDGEGRAGKEGRKRAAAQTVTKPERKGEEIEKDRLQENHVGGGIHQDQSEVKKKERD